MSTHEKHAPLISKFYTTSVWLLGANYAHHNVRAKEERVVIISYSPGSSFVPTIVCVLPNKI